MSIENPNVMNRLKKIENKLENLEKRIANIEDLVGKNPKPRRPGPPHPGRGPEPPEPFRF
ncbi:MAG: hypothetical protein GF317_07245 [Candidatus Lokiarchaeota archaeon]|nr:hypothetical protein [Candidatus Lokiarchaeota archaeon]MBD3199503.1 hypothetical protein [Candidatus Lokiarchaeota archaeon]